MAGNLILPVTTTPELLAKIRAGLQAVDPGAKGKITLSLDHYGHLIASAGVRGQIKKVSIALGAYGAIGGGGRPEGGVEGVIQWEE